MTSSQNSLLEGVSEDEQLAMAISASMEKGDGDGKKTSGPTEGVTGAPGTAACDQEVGDEMTQAIALSLSEGDADDRPSPTPSMAEVYRPKSVPEKEPTGADVVRIQVQWALPHGSCRSRSSTLQGAVPHTARISSEIVSFSGWCGMEP